MDNVELLKQAYQSFGEGNIPAVLSLMDENIEWNTATSWPFLENKEPVIGPQNVVAKIFAPIPEHYDNFHIDIKDLFGAGDKVVMEGYYTGTWKATGKTFKANAVHIWNVKDGKITRYFQAVDSAEIMNA